MSGDIQAGYDSVAFEYAEEFLNELNAKPFDRKMLDWLAERVDRLGPICDLGCGPAQVAEYLHTRGAEVCGIDLSPEMVKCAQALHPHIPFQQGNMRALHNVADGAFGGIAAFYSIIHIPRDGLPQALRELRRVLNPAGVLLLTFHIGTETIHKEEWWGKPVSIDFYFYETREMQTNLCVAGFEMLETITRDPYPEIEFQSRRAYIFARPSP